MQKLYIFFITLLLCSSSTTFSQTSDFDTKGKDFWIAFPPNFHGTGTDDDNDYLYLYISAEIPTKGVISFRGQQNVSFSITAASPIFTYKVFYKAIELLDAEESEKPSPRAFHITSENEVTVYGLSKAEKTSDAFLAFPTDVLGTNYYVMSYNSDDSQRDSENDTPSQFAVVASEDATTITITLPTKVINSRQGGPRIREITLNKGQVYLLQAKPSTNDDLTGSHITSNKPIAVFGSQQRAAIPYDYNGNRDFLIEEMPAVSKWGYDAYLLPLPKPNKGTGNYNLDIFRILASEDGTQVTINKRLVKTLKAGDFYEGDLTEAAAITSSAPILVSLYKKSTGGDDNSSDPYMMLVPPAEQFLKSYRWINSQVYDTTTERRWTGRRYEDVQVIKPIYDQQFVIVVAPNSAVTSVKLDNATPKEKFIAIPNSDYSFATISVQDGVHTISADSGIGIYVFGYGNADSYGYIGGMNMINTKFVSSTIKPLDISAASGDIVRLPLILDSLQAKPRIQSVGIDHFTATIQFNATLLTPTDTSQRGKIANGFQTATITGKYANQLSGDTLTTIELTAGLGDAESTPIDILTFTWFDTAGDTIDSKNSVKSATFRLTDVWTDPTHGVRLINPQEGTMSLSIEPNPTTSFPVNVILSGQIEPTATLIIYTLMGRQVADYSRQLRNELTTGGDTKTLQISLPNISKGVYFLRLASGENSIVRSLLVE
ncbi:MAG: T9SS type A sorting domain-containing protein [Ignavibacteria bacterium]|nr:T9SS type A sorting domain-containing protein [Ignavibacteria bacterium]